MYGILGEMICFLFIPGLLSPKIRRLGSYSDNLICVVATLGMSDCLHNQTGKRTAILRIILSPHQ